MGKLSEDQLARKELQDTVRTIVRLKHRMAVRRELNEIEAELLNDFDRRVTSGQPFKPNLAALVKGELE